MAGLWTLTSRRPVLETATSDRVAMLEAITPFRSSLRGVAWWQEMGNDRHEICRSVTQAAAGAKGGRKGGHDGHRRGDSKYAGSQTPPVQLLARKDIWKRKVFMDPRPCLPIETVRNPQLPRTDSRDVSWGKNLAWWKKSSVLRSS